MSAATYRVPSDVAWTIDSPTDGTADVPVQASVVLSRMPDGEPVVLTGSAAQIWLLALDSPHADAVVEEISRLSGEDRVDVAGPVRELLRDLDGRGLLLSPAP